MTVSRLATALLSASIGLLPIAAPEHVHEREEQGHAHVVVHRHMPRHGIVEQHEEHQTSVADDDAPLLTLTATYTVPGTVVLDGPGLVAGTLHQASGLRRIERLETKFDVPIHGPPRAPNGLRAPPFSPAS